MVQHEICGEKFGSGIDLCLARSEYPMLLASGSLSSLKKHNFMRPFK